MGPEPKEPFWWAVLAAVALKAVRSHPEGEMSWALPVIALFEEQQRLAVVQMPQLWAVQLEKLLWDVEMCFQLAELGNLAVAQAD